MQNLSVQDLLGLPIAVLLVAGFTAMWVAWLFQGSVRNWICACMSDRWRARTPRHEIMVMQPDDLLVFIVGVSDMPPLLRGLMTCPLCASAHVSLAATLFALPLIFSLWLLPLVWGCGAWIANRICTRFK